jgi:hypothetical protein
VQYYVGRPFLPARFLSLRKCVPSSECGQTPRHPSILEWMNNPLNWHICRLAIRAVQFGPETDSLLWAVAEAYGKGISTSKETRGH